MARASVRLLSERLRSVIAAIAAVVVGVVSGIVDDRLSFADRAVFLLLVYLVVYLAVTVFGFHRAPNEEIRAWAVGPGRGTFLQRYLLGTAPGPGVSIFIAASALAVAMLWLPSGGDVPGRPARVSVSVVLVVVAWMCVVQSFAIAFFADNLVEEEKALQFPGDSAPRWSDYLYFAVAVMTTFGTTDVTVASSELRRTVMLNAVIAFVFNTIIIAALVSALPN